LSWSFMPVTQYTTRHVTAIVTTHDSAAVLPDCLKALKDQNISVIVVDNASSDACIDIAESFAARVLINAKNQGFGRAMTQGVEAAETPLVLLVNPDLVLAEGAIAAFLVAVNRYQDAALFGPRIIEEGGRVFFPNHSLLAPILKNDKQKDWTPNGDCCVPFMSGACMMIRRDIMLALGGFDPNIFLFYEDNDLCRRIHEAGHALVHVDRALVRHARAGSSSPKPGRVFKSRFHQAWSRLYVSRKWGIEAPTTGTLILHYIKLTLATLIGSGERKERYSGTIAGIKAFQNDETALGHEGLPLKVEAPQLPH
jgi:N-acetylglucosaminyl-diphospho-decaprenol L-rhamnosyltransferase